MSRNAFLDTIDDHSRRTSIGGFTVNLVGTLRVHSQPISNACLAKLDSRLFETIKNFLSTSPIVEEMYSPWIWNVFHELLDDHSSKTSTWDSTIIVVGGR